MSNLRGKIALVTGAGHGIGKEIALALGRSGAEVVVTDVSDEIFEVGKAIESVGTKAFPVKCDVTDAKEAEAIEEKVVEKYERIEILVNNAGIYPQKPFLEMTMEEWNKVLTVNLTGVFHCTKAVVPKMVQQKYGKIVNIASIAGAVVGYVNLAHYSASKAAVVGFTKSLALEMAQYGINVNAIAPGYTRTEATIAEGVYEATVDHMVDAQCVKRGEGPEDLVGTAIFLASKESDFSTGQLLIADGGVWLR